MQNKNLGITVCLFGGTLLAAGLARADSVTLVRSPIDGRDRFGFGSALARNDDGDISSSYGDDNAGGGLTWDAATSDGSGFTDALAYAHIGSTLLRVDADLGPTGAYALGAGLQYFTVSSQLEATISWSATGASFARYLVREFFGSGWGTLTVANVMGTGSTTWTFFPDKIYLVNFDLRVTGDNTDNYGEFDFGPASIPLPSGAALALASLGMIGVRRRR